MESSMGGVLEGWRLALGLSLEQASRRAESRGVSISASQILRIERGGVIPRARVRFEAAMLRARVARDDALAARARLDLGWLDLREENHMAMAAVLRAAQVKTVRCVITSHGEDAAAHRTETDTPHADGPRRARPGAKREMP